MRCPNCKTESNGRFCPNCGTTLRGTECPACGAQLAAGARFCTQCGKAVRGGGGSRSTVPFSWVVAAAAVIVAAIAILLPRGSGAPAGGAPFADETGADAALLDPLSGSPREQADRLFNRIMTEKSNGNLDQAVFFTEMALQAYQMAEPLDIDGLYHVSLIEAVASDYTGAEETARRILDAVPTHLLGLAALAEAALGAGDTATAKDAWNKYLDNYDKERVKSLKEYQDHAPILEVYEQDARKLTGR
jgi:hypothetical protein